VETTLYSGQHVQTTDALVTQFEKATGITVHVRSDDEDVLANQIAAEGAKSPADVIFTENSQVLEFLPGKGLLAKVNAATLADTPAKYDSPDGRRQGEPGAERRSAWSTSITGTGCGPRSACPTPRRGSPT
jgi:iron(III) transport system substrate-binding protein